MSIDPEKSGSPAPTHLLGALLDLELRSFAGPRLLRVAYVLALVLLGLSAVAGFVVWTANGGTGFLVGLFLVALMFLLLLMFRVFLEVTKLLYRLSDDVAVLAGSARPQQVPGVPALVAPGPVAPAFGRAPAPAEQVAPVIAPVVPLATTSRQADVVGNGRVDQAPSQPSASPLAPSGSPRGAAVVPEAPSEVYPSQQYAAQVEFGRQAAYAAVQEDYAARAGQSHVVVPAANRSTPAPQGREVQPAGTAVSPPAEYAEPGYGPAGYVPGAYGQGQHVQGDYGQAQYAQADYAQAEYAQAEYAQAEYAQAEYAQAEYAQGEYAPGEYGQAQYVQGEYAPGAYPQVPYAQADYGQANYAQADYGQANYAQAVYGQADYAQAQRAQAQYAQAQYAQAEYGPSDQAQVQYGQGQYPQQSYGQDPYAQSPYQQGQYDQGRYAQAPNAEDLNAEDLNAEELNAQELDARDPFARTGYAEQADQAGYRPQGQADRDRDGRADRDHGVNNHAPADYGRAEYPTQVAYPGLAGENGTDQAQRGHAQGDHAQTGYAEGDDARADSGRQARPTRSDHSGQPGYAGLPSRHSRTGREAAGGAGEGQGNAETGR